MITIHHADDQDDEELLQTDQKKRRKESLNCRVITSYGWRMLWKGMKLSEEAGIPSQPDQFTRVSLQSTRHSRGSRSVWAVDSMKEERVFR